MEGECQTLGVELEILRMEDVAIQLSKYHGREIEKLEAIRYGDQ